VTIRFLLDTNVLSEPARPSPHPGLLRRLREHREESAVAAPVWHELLFGCKRLPPSRKRETIESYLFDTIGSSLPILPYDQMAAEWHAQERARLAALGKTPPFVDGQIAAIAKVNHLILVTSNGLDFASFEGLQVEDWRNELPGDLHRGRGL
jgi:tRNA(fMet)-specific endonuclease VapC